MSVDPDGCMHIPNTCFYFSRDVDSSYIFIKNDVKTTTFYNMNNDETAELLGDAESGCYALEITGCDTSEKLIIKERPISMYRAIASNEYSPEYIIILNNKDEIVGIQYHATTDMQNISTRIQYNRFSLDNISSVIIDGRSNKYQKSQEIIDFIINIGKIDNKVVSITLTSTII